MNREAIDTWLGRTILVLVLGALIFGPLALGAVRPTEFVVLQWLLLGALVVWVFRLWLAPAYRFLLPPTAWAVLPFLIYAVWRYRAADVEYLARQEFILVLLAAMVFLLLLNNLHGQSELRVLAAGLVALGTGVAMYGIYQWLTGSTHVWHFERPGDEGRGSGTYISPNHLAGLLEMICPLALTFTLLKGFGPVPRILFAYASFVMLVGIAATGSRGGWLSTGLAMLVMALVLIRGKKHIWTVVVLVLLVGGTGKWLYSRALEKRVYLNPSTEQHDDIRLRIWDSAQRMWRDHPWTGVGPNHFDYRYRAYRIPNWEVQPRPGHAHNDYWNTLVDWGAIGLGLILLPFLTAGVGLVFSWKYLQRSGEITGSRISMVLGCFIGLLALLIHSFFDFNMHIPANALLAAAWLAILTTHWRFATQRFWVTARWPLRAVGTLLLVGTVVYLAPITWRQTGEALALHQADRLRLTSPERMAALKKAFTAEPMNFETADAIGEELRMRASTGGDDHLKLAAEAVEWFQRAIALNPWDSQPELRVGQALDWLGRHDEAEAHFKRALQIDPNHWKTRGMMGWHYYQIDNFTETKRWMEKSLELEGTFNDLASTYLELAKKALAGQRHSHPALQSLPDFR